MMNDLLNYHFNRGYNKALKDARDKLASKMRTNYGEQPRDDVLVVDWNKIRNTLEQLEKDNE